MLKLNYSHNFFFLRVTSNNLTVINVIVFDCICDLFCSSSGGRGGFNKGK